MAREQIDHRQILSEAAMAKIPEDAKRHGIKNVVFSGGGDPLLNRFTVETARKCKDYGIFTGIDNQGYLLKDPTAFNFIRYSVDAATSDTYQKIHSVPKGDGWEVVNANIANHARLRREGHKIEMGLAFLITPYNFHEVYEFCEWGQQYDPDFMHIRPAYLDPDYLDQKYPGGGIKIKDEIVPNLRETALRIKKDFPNVHFTIDKFEGYWSKKLYDKCRATPLKAVTSGDGAFLVCKDRGIMKEEDYLRYGNYNVDSFEDIWWGDAHKKVIASIDLDRCPRCVDNFTNELIQATFVDEDAMKLDLI